MTRGFVTPEGVKAADRIEYTGMFTDAARQAPYDDPPALAKWFQAWLDGCPETEREGFRADAAVSMLLFKYRDNLRPENRADDDHPIIKDLGQVLDEVGFFKDSDDE